MILAYRETGPAPSPRPKARAMVGPMGSWCALLFCPILAAQPAAAQTDPAPPLVTASAQLTLDDMADVSGGTARGNRVLDKLEGVAELDGTRIGTSWLAARADVGLTNGRKISGDLVGDIQGVDNIEGVRGFRIYNAWISASGSLVGIEAGVIDLNSQFDVHNVAALFVNSSFGVGPSLSHSGLNGPSIYPNSGLGVVGWLDDTGQSIRVRLGVFDGVPNDPDDPARTTFRLSGSEGALVIGEIDKTWGSHGRLAVGGWGYTSRLPRLRDPSRSDHGSVGGFVTLEDTLLTLPSDRRLDGWVRGGLANPAFNIVSSYVGAGLVLHGVFAAGGKDGVGVAVAHADLSRGMDVTSGAVTGASTAGSGTETTIELTYQRRLRDWIAVQPDLQYVLSPGGRQGVGNAVVLGLRLVLSVG